MKKKKVLFLIISILSIFALLSTSLLCFADSGLLNPNTWTNYIGAEELILYRDADNFPDGYFGFNTDGYTQKLGYTTTSTIWRDRLTCYYDKEGNSSNVTIDAYNEYIESTNYEYGLLNKSLTLGVASSGNFDFYPTHIGFKDMFAYRDSYNADYFSYPLFCITVSPDNTEWLDDSIFSGSILGGFTTFVSHSKGSYNTQRFVQNLTTRVSIQSNGMYRYEFCIDLLSIPNLLIRNGYAYLMDIGVEFTPTAVNNMANADNFILSLYTFHFDDAITIPTTNDALPSIKLLPSHYLENFLDIDIYLDGEDFNLFNFLGGALKGFFEFEIAPGFSLGVIGFTVFSIGLLFAVLKYFAGG